MDLHDHTIKKLSEIQVGFKEDCEKLLRRYADHKTHSFAKFCDVWKEMNFSLVFVGVKNFEEMSKQTELFFFEAKKYFLYAPNIYYKTGALYLFYGLYYKQPLKGVVKIRLLRTELQVLEDYATQAKAARASEAMYVYARLRHDAAFDYIRTQTSLAPELSRTSRYFTMKNDTYKEHFGSKIEADVRALIANEDVSNITQSYERALKDYLGSTGNVNVMTFDTDVQKELRRIFEVENPNVTAGGESESIGEKRSRLKKKAAGTEKNTYKMSRVNFEPCA